MRKIVFYGDERLRTKCKPITKFDESTKQFAHELAEAMKHYYGAGLAAPQLGVLIRMFAICYVGTDDQMSPIMGEPIIYINPKIEVIGDETWTYAEGCLSIPGVEVPVERPVKIKVEAYRPDGSFFTEECDYWKAKAICHENDHLNGVLMVDRTDKKRRKLIEPHLRRIKNKVPST